MDQGTENGTGGELQTPRLTPEEYRLAINSTAAQGSSPEDRFALMETFAVDLEAFGKEQGATEQQIREAQRNFRVSEIASRPEYFGINRANKLEDLRSNWEQGIDSTWNGRVVLGKGKGGPAPAKAELGFNDELRKAGLNADGTTNYDAWKAMGGDQRGLWEVVKEGGRQVSRMLEGAFVKGPLNPLENDYDEALRNPKAVAFMNSLRPEDREQYRNQVAEIFGVSEGKAEGWLSQMVLEIANRQTPATKEAYERFEDADLLPDNDRSEDTARILNGLLLMLSTRQAAEDYSLITQGLGSLVGGPIVRKAADIAPGLTGAVLAETRQNELLRDPEFLDATLKYEKDTAAYEFFRRMEGSANVMRENATIMADLSGLDLEEVLQISEGMSLITDPATIAGFGAGAGFKGLKVAASGAVKTKARVLAKGALAKGSLSGAKAALKKGSADAAKIAEFRILPQVLPQEGTTAFLLGKMGKFSRVASEKALQLERKVGGDVIETIAESGQKVVSRTGGSMPLRVAIGATGGLITATQMEGDPLEKIIGVAGAAGLSPFIARKGLVMGSMALRSGGDRFLIASASKAAADGTLDAGRLAARLHGLAYDDAAFARATGLFGSRFANWAMQATDNAIEGALVDGALGYVATGSWQGAVEEAVSGAVFDNVGYYSARGANRVQNLLTSGRNVPRGATVGFYAQDPLALEADRRTVGQWMTSLDPESQSFAKALLDDGSPESVGMLRNLMDVSLFHKVPVLLASGTRNADLVTQTQIGDELFSAWTEAKSKDGYKSSNPINLETNLKREKPLTGDHIQQMWERNRDRQNQGFTTQAQVADGTVVPHLVVNMDAARDPVSTLRHEGFHALHDVVQLQGQRDAFVDELANQWGLDDDTKLGEEWEHRQQQVGVVAKWKDLSDAQKKDGRRWLLNELGADYFQFLLTPRAEGMKGGMVALAQQLNPGAKSSPLFWGMGNRMIGAARLKLEEMGVNTGLGGLYDGNGQKITARRSLTRGKSRGDSVSYSSKNTANNAIRNLEVSDVLNQIETNTEALQNLLDRIDSPEERATIRRLYEFKESIGDVARSHGMSPQKQRADVRSIVNNARKGFTETDRTTFGLRRWTVDPAADGTFRVAEIQNQELMTSTRELDKLAAELVIAMERLNEEAQFELERKTSEAFLDLRDQIDNEQRSRSRFNRERARQATEEARQDVGSPAPVEPSNPATQEAEPVGKETIQVALETLEQIPASDQTGAVKVRRNAKGTLQASGRFFTEDQLAALETVFPEHMLAKIRQMNPELRDNFGADHLVFHRPATKAKADNSRQFANRPLQQDRVVALGWNMDTREDGNVRLQTIVLDGIDEKGTRKGLVFDLDQEQRRIDNGEPSVLRDTFGDLQEADRKLQLYLARLAQGQPGAGGRGAMRITPKERDVLNAFVGMGVKDTSLAKKAGKPDPADEFGRTPNPNPGRQIRRGDNAHFNSLRVERIDEIRAGEGVARYPIDYQGLSMNFEPGDVPPNASRAQRFWVRADVTTQLPRLLRRVFQKVEKAPQHWFDPTQHDPTTSQGFQAINKGHSAVLDELRAGMIREARSLGLNDFQSRHVSPVDFDPRTVDRRAYELGLNDTDRSRLVQQVSEAQSTYERIDAAMDLIAAPSLDGADTMAGFLFADLARRDREGLGVDQAALFEAVALQSAKTINHPDLTPEAEQEINYQGEPQKFEPDPDLPPFPGQESRDGLGDLGLGDIQFEPGDKGFSGAEFGQNDQQQPFFAGVATPGEVLRVAAFDLDGHLIEHHEVRADSEGNMRVDFKTRNVAEIEVQGENGVAKGFEVSNGQLSGTPGDLAGRFVDAVPLADRLFPDSAGVMPSRDLTREAGFSRLPAWIQARTPPERVPSSQAETQSSLQKGESRSTQPLKESSTQKSGRQRLLDADTTLRNASLVGNPEALTDLREQLNLELREETKLPIPAQVRPGRFQRSQKSEAKHPPRQMLYEDLAVATADFQSHVADEAVAYDVFFHFATDQQRRDARVFDAGDDRKVIKLHPEATPKSIREALAHSVAPERRKPFDDALNEQLANPENIAGTYFIDKEGNRKIREIGDSETISESAKEYGVVLTNGTDFFTIPLKNRTPVNTIAKQGFLDTTLGTESHAFARVLGRTIGFPAQAAESYGPLAIAAHEAVQGTKPAVEMIELSREHAQFLQDQAVRKATPPVDDTIGDLIDVLNDIATNPFEATDLTNVPDQIQTITEVGTLEEVQNDPNAVLDRLKGLVDLTDQQRQTIQSQDTSGFDKLLSDMDSAITATRQDIARIEQEQAEAARQAEIARNTPKPAEQNAAAKAALFNKAKPTYDQLLREHDRLAGLFGKLHRLLGELPQGNTAKTPIRTVQSERNRSLLAKLEGKDQQKLTKALERQDKLFQEVQDKRSEMFKVLEDAHRQLLETMAPEFGKATSYKQLGAVQAQATRAKQVLNAMADRVLSPLAAMEQQQARAQANAVDPIIGALASQIDRQVTGRRLTNAEKIRLVRETFDNDQDAIDIALDMLDRQGSRIVYEGGNREIARDSNRVPYEVLEALMSPDALAQLYSARQLNDQSTVKRWPGPSRSQGSIKQAVQELDTVSNGLQDIIDVYDRIDSDVQNVLNQTTDMKFEPSTGAFGDWPVSPVQRDSPTDLKFEPHDWSFSPDFETFIQENNLEAMPGIAEVDGQRTSKYHTTIDVNEITPSEYGEWDEIMENGDSAAEIREMVAELEKGNQLPPILVRGDKHNADVLPQVLDGHHRAAAYRLAGQLAPVQYDHATIVEIWNRIQGDSKTPSDAMSVLTP